MRILTDSDVKSFQPANFQSSIVLFTMTGCPYCEIMKPEWNRALNQRKNVNVLEINASVYGKMKSLHPKFFDKMSVHGFPTVFAKTGNSAVPFELPRTAENFVQFMDKHVKKTGGKPRYGTYQRGPKKGKLKKGFKFVDGVATSVRNFDANL